MISACLFDFVSVFMFTSVCQELSRGEEVVPTFVMCAVDEHYVTIMCNK